MAPHRVVSSPVAAALRFASRASQFGLSSSTGSRRGGDNCTAAARRLCWCWQVVFARGSCKLLRRRETGTHRAFSRAGTIVLSCSSFVVMLLGSLSRDLVLSSWCARSCLLVAPCETIALDDAFRTEDVVALVLPTSAASLTGHGCCHVLEFQQ